MAGGEFPIPQDELREAFRRDSHEYWAAAAQREQRARASGEGLAAVWKRQEGEAPSPDADASAEDRLRHERTRGSIFRSCPTIRRGFAALLRRIF